MKMETRRRMDRYERVYTTDTYVDGNTVRRVETVPNVPERRREHIDREQEARRRHNKRVARRNQEKALRMSRGYVMFLSMAVLLTCLSCIYQAAVRSYRAHEPDLQTGEPGDGYYNRQCGCEKADRDIRGLKPCEGCCGKSAWHGLCVFRSDHVL